MLLLLFFIAACAEKKAREESSEKTEVSKVVEPESEEVDTTYWEDDYIEQF